MADLPPTTLTIARGSSLSFEVVIYDKNDQLEDLTGATAAIVNWVKDPAQASSVVIRKTVAGNLTINIPESKLVATLTQAEANALAVGNFIGQANISFGASHYKTLPFVVVVLPAIAPDN